MKKRLLTMALALCMLLSLLPMGAAAADVESNGSCGKNGDNLTYTIYTDGSAVISGSGEMQDYSFLHASPFSRSNIRSVVIGNGVTSIGKYAFTNCAQLADAPIPDSVKAIGEHAFAGCSSLTSIRIPEGVKILSGAEFDGCTSLKRVELPDSLTELGGGTFADCTSLKDIELPDGLTTIGGAAFRNCTSLTSIEIPGSVTTILDDAFMNCSSLLDVTIANGVTDICFRAFYGCSSLKSFTIPNTVTVIWDEAFRGCSSLKSITIPKSVTRIDNKVFVDCSSLTQIDVEQGNSAYCSVGGILFGKDQKTLVAYPVGRSSASYTIPAGVTTIKVGAFGGCRNLTYIDVEKGNTRFSSVDGVLFYRDQEVLVLYPAGITNTTYLVPKSVKELGSFAFYGTSSLLSVTLPECLTEIYYEVFEGDSALTDVYYDGTQKMWDHVYVTDTADTLRAATIHCKKLPWEGGSIYDQQTDLDVTVYVNQKSSEKPEESFVLCKGARVADISRGYDTDENGFVQLSNYNGGSVTVNKSGYVKRTFTEERIHHSATVYLQQESDGPVISGLWMNDVDILHEEFGVPLTGGTPYTVEPEIYWSRDKGMEVKLVQDARSVPITDATLTLTWSDHFDISKPIFLEATDESGRTARKQLKLTALSKVPDALDGFSVSFGDSISFTLPEGAEFFAGQNLKTGIYSPIPVSFTIENGKVYAAIGYQRDYASGDNGLEPKTFSKSLQNVFKKWKAGVSDYQTMLDARKATKGLVQFAKGSLGWDVGWEVMGFAEGYITPEGSVQWLDSGMIVGGSLGVDGSLPFTVGPIPAFFEAKLEAEVQARANLGIAAEAKAFTPNFSMTGSVALSGGVGVGVPNVIATSGGLTGELDPRWDVYSGATNFFQLKAKLKAYASLNAGGFIYSDDWDLAEGVWYEYPDKGKAMAAQDTESGFRPYDAALYEREDLTYLAKGSEFFPAQAMAAEEADTRVLLSNAYRSARPQLAQFADGTMLAVWLGADGSEQANDLQLYYTTNAGGSWSAPQPVCDDGTMDSAPTLVVVGDTAYLAWMNAAADVTDVQTLDALAPLMDISAAVFDRSTSGFQSTKLTENNSTMDAAPVICGDGDTVYVVWQRNNGDHWFSTEAVNDVVARRCVGGEWQEETTICTGLQPIITLAADHDGQTLHTAYCLDTDGDLNTVEDVELYEDGVQLSDNAVVDSGAQYDGHTLYWYQGGQLVSKGGVLMERVPTDQYRFVRCGAERAVLFGEQNGLYTTVLASFCDSESGLWSAPVPVTDGDAARPSFGAVLTENGLVLLTNDVQVVGDGTDGDPYGKASITLTNVPQKCDLTLEALIFDGATNVQGGTVQGEATVKNNGNTPVRGVKIEVREYDGAVLCDLTFDDTLLPGEERSYPLSYTEENQIAELSLTAKVLPLNGMDAAPSDNEKTERLTFQDLTVENMGCGVRADGTCVVYADIVNRSNVTSDPVKAELRKGSADAEPVDRFTPRRSMDGLDAYRAAFVVEDEPGTVYYITIAADADADLANNQDFVILPQVETQTCAHEYQLQIVPPTCTETGYTIHKCAKCGASFIDTYTAATGHKWDAGKVTQQPTVSSEGVRTYTCTVCGETKTESIPKLTPDDPTPPTTKPDDPTPASPKPTTKPDDTKPSPKPDDTKPAPKPVSNPFTDVKKGDYFYDPVLWALTHEPQITDGMTETTFAPGDTCTRGQVVTFLWRAMGCEEPTKTDNPFTDVAGGDYFYKAVLWAVEKGITDGTSATTFSPNDPCTRAHVVTFLCRAEGNPKGGSSNPFADVAAGEYYTDAVLWAVSKGITDGTSDTTFSPADPCTRGQIVTFLYRDMK